MLIQILISLQLAYGHGGRTDSKGGHNGPGGYHYHHKNSYNTNTKNESTTSNEDLNLKLRKDCYKSTTLTDIRNCKSKIETRIKYYEENLLRASTTKEKTEMAEELKEFKITLADLEKIEQAKIKTLETEYKIREKESQKEIEKKKAIAEIQAEIKAEEKRKTKRALIGLGIGIATVMMIGIIGGL